MVIFIHGEDEYRSRSYVREQKARFKTTRDPNGYNSIQLDGCSIDTVTLARELGAVPFLADRRMLILKDILSSTDKALLEFFLAYLAAGHVPESMVLIVWQTQVPGKSAVAKELKATFLRASFIQEFPVIQGKALESWIGQEVARRHARIAPEAVVFLAHNTTQTWELATALDQVAAYARDEEITLALVQAVMPVVSSETVFTLVEAMVSHDRARAMIALSARREAGDDDGLIFGLLVWQTRLVVALHDFCRQHPEARNAEAATALGIHPFVAQKNWGLAQKSLQETLVKYLDRLVTYDRQIKSGTLTLPLALELFIAQA